MMGKRYCATCQKYVADGRCLERVDDRGDAPTQGPLCGALCSRWEAVRSLESTANFLARMAALADVVRLPEDGGAVVLLVGDDGMDLALKVAPWVRHYNTVGGALHSFTVYPADGPAVTVARQFEGMTAEGCRYGRLVKVCGVEMSFRDRDAENVGHLGGAGNGGQ